MSKSEGSALVAIVVAVLAVAGHCMDVDQQCDDCSRLYRSGQAKLFTSESLRRTESTGQRIDEIYVHPVPKLADYLPNLSYHDNDFFRTRSGKVSLKGYSHAVNEDQLVLNDVVRTQSSHKGTGYVRGGPRAKIAWKPSEVVACIVTCGGLCPGLNDVIHELVQMLHFNYSVDKIYGIRFGYRGFCDPAYPFLDLTPKTVGCIRKTGGTFLKSSRGGFNLDGILAAVLEHNISQMYIIGGDGTHRGATQIYEEIRKRGLKVAVVGIPKTIDNDIAVIDRSFGFDTAVEEAEKAVASARVEASSAPLGIGLVKLMGRSSGFIAAHATLASRDVDLCLIGEIPIELDGEGGIINHINGVLSENGFCTIVVAEGAGGNLLKESSVKDASGNVIPDDIGLHLKSVLKRRLGEMGKDVSIKYHDPSYMIRSVPANAGDAKYCMILAQNAVHGAMAGFTGFTSGVVNTRTVLLPISLVTSCSPIYLNPHGLTWDRVLCITHQPFDNFRSNLAETLPTNEVLQANTTSSIPAEA